MSSRHNKYVSVTDWFAPPPSSKGTTTTSLATGIAAGGANFAGGSWGQGGSGGGLTIQIIKTNDTTPASNSNVYSALRVHNSYISKDKDERTSGKLSSDVGFEVGEFVSGASGAICYIDPETLQTTAELDRLKVRIKAYFETLEIVNVNSVGGKQIISPAGAITCAKVEVKGPITETIHVTDDEGNPLYDEDGNPITETIIVSEDNGIPEDTYRCYFLAELDGDKVENRFHEGDQAYCQTFNAFTGEQSKVSNTYYWRLVTGVTVNPIEKDGKQWHYIDLSISDCDTDSDAPKEGDVICHRGSRTDNDRRNLLEFSAVDTFSPSITLYQGVGVFDPSNNQYPYSLTGKDVISYGVNKMTNRAFMNVYGDMYVGDRDGKSFIRFDEVGGLTIKGNLSAGTTLEGSDLTIEQRINAAADAYKEDVNQFKAAVEASFNDVLNQIDGAIETYFLDPVPTLDNEPAVNWTTNEAKANHVGDLYYSAEGKAYRFQYNEIQNEDGSKTYQYYWNVITDTDITLALANAAKAQDTADSKRKIFVQQPKTNDSYQEGDMWANASYVDPTTERLVYDGDLLRAIVDKQAGYPFSIDHWILASKYTDDTAAIAAQEAAEKAQTAADNAQADATAAANRLNAWAEDGVISPTEKQGIKEEYARVLADNDHINNEYEKYFLGTPTDYNNAYLPYITALIGLFTSELETVPIPNNFETLQTAYYTARTNALNVISSAAKKVADDAQAAADNAREEAEKALTSAEEAKEVVYDMNLAVTGSAEYVREAFADGIINKGERATIENYVHQIDTVSAQVEESYKEVVSNQLLVGSNELENLKTSYATFVSATAELKNSISDISKMESVANINKATFENKYNNFNAAYSTYTQWLNAASKYVEYALNSRVDSTIEALGGYSYLKNALNNEKTTVTGGLVLTTMLALGYTDENLEYHINAGINGSAAKNNDIVIWAGGSNIDKFVEPNNAQAADFLVRGDGTGYAAGGNFWWDSNGIIHADPMSFVISEQSVGMLLASFQVYYDVNPATGKTEPYAIDPKVPFTTLNVASDLLLDTSAAIHFGKIKLRYDSTNNAVCFTHDDGDPVNLYTTGGISMYGQGNTSVTTIMDAIANNLDPNTLEIKNGLLTVIGGTGGGTSGATTLGGLSNVGSWANSVADVDRIMYQAAGSSNWVAKSLSSIGGVSGDYLPLSGGELTGSLAVTAKSNGYWRGGIRIDGTTDMPPSLAFHIPSKIGSRIYVDANSPYDIIHELSTFSPVEKRVILHSSNYSSYALPLSGGTLTNSTASILCINRTGDNYVTPIMFSQNNNGIGYIGISKDKEPVFMPSTETTWKVILHDGNYSNYALPLTGGTLTGTLELYSNDSNYGLLRIGKVSQNGYNYSILHQPITPGVNRYVALELFKHDGTLVGGLGINVDGVAFVSDKTANTHNIWHSGNFTPSSYLPLTGGTIKGTNRNLLILEQTVTSYGNGAYITLKNGDYTTVIGQNTAYGTVIDTTGGGTNSSLHIRNNGTLRFRVGSQTDETANTIWHSGNDGSGSGLDADLLDGKHANDFFRDRGITSTFDDILSSSVYYTSSKTPISGVYEYGTLVSFRAYPTCLQFYASDNFVAIGNSKGGLFVRSHWNAQESITTSWKQIAFTDSNVASATYATTAGTCSGNAGSATKLQTARTIWGQSFDGTGNVSGDLSLLNYRILGNNAIDILNSQGAWVILGAGCCAKQWNTYVDGYDIHFRYGSSSTTGMLLNHDGRVGIGTTTPNQKLHVEGSIQINGAIGGVRSIVSNTTNGYFVGDRNDGLGTSDGGLLLYSYKATPISLYTNSQERMRITSSGNVGIGMSNPTLAKLQVVGNEMWTAGFDSPNTLVYCAHKNGHGVYIGSKSSSNSIPLIEAWHGQTTLGSGGTCDFMITAEGKIGIGTNSPSDKLDVRGNIITTGDIKMNNQCTMWAKNASGSYEQWIWPRWSDNATYMNYGSGNFYIRNSSSAHVMTMLNSGNVGIGTTSPSSKLHVSGDILATDSIKINSSAWTYFSIDRGSAGISSIGGVDPSGVYFAHVKDSTATYMYLKVGSGLTVHSNILATGGITMYSDQRKKTILGNVELSLKQIANAPLIEHYYNSDDAKTTHVGSIAQYWASMNDWFCKLDSEGFYTMEIQNCALASAISIARELDRYESKTDKTIKRLKKRICQLEEEVERLRAS